MQGPAFPQPDAPLDLAGRLLRIFYAPRRSFAALGEDPDWLDWFVPVAIVCLLGVGAHFLTRDIVYNPETPLIKQQLQTLGEEQRLRHLGDLETARDKGWLLVVTGTFSSLVLVSGILWLLARFVFTSEVSYRSLLVVKGYGSLIIATEWLVRTALILAWNSPVVQTGPGLLVPESMVRTFAGQTLLAVSVFDLWQAVVLGLGVSVVARVPVGRAVFAVVALWVFYVMGLGLLGSMALSAGAVPVPVPTP
ncbi:MAG: YIP1 family protein [Candidatus Latescibacteria bacterium]|nr:YIP1 family protein [Candidatus Latescibacterota bacterium]